MAVQIVNMETKILIHDDFYINKMNKTEIGNEYGISRKTVSRIIKEIDEYYKPAPDVVDVDPATEEGQTNFSIGVGQFGPIDTISSGHKTPEDMAHIYDEDLEVCDLECYEYTFVLTSDSCSINRIGEDTADVQVIDNTDPNFDEVFSIIANSGNDHFELERAFKLISKKAYWEDVSNGFITVIPEENAVRYTHGGEEVQVSGKLCERLIELAKSNDESGLTGLMNFASKLVNNPSYRAVNELYSFLEAADIKIDEDGYVECYKKVNDNFTDCHSGKIDNSVGSMVQVMRNMVDEDSKNTCSYGLHVCSKSYLPHYCGSRIIKVLVDPADFVAIPQDYYSWDNESTSYRAKARVCKYQVIEEVTDRFNL